MAGDFMTAQQIYENFVNGHGPDGLVEAAMQISEVEATYNARAKQIETLAASMEEGWTGDAGGAAQRGAGPLAVEHAGAAEAMATAKELLTDQATQWADTKSRVQPVPPVPEAPSTFKQLITFGSANRDYEGQVRQSNEAAQANVDAMTTWTSASDVNGRTMPSSYGQIDPGTLDVGMQQPETPPAVHGRSTGTDTGHRTSGGDDRGGTTTSGTTTRDTTTPGTTTPGTTPGTTTSSGHQPSDATGTTGFVPPALRPGSTGGTGSFPGSGGLSGDSGLGDGFIPGIGGGFPGGGEGSTTGGGRLGGGTGSGSGLGDGKQAGARGLGGGSGSGAGTQGEPVGRGAGSVRGGAAGRPGASGMGGMPHGGKGDKEEDREHQRKYVLADDEAFQIDSDGERITDPRTGLPPVPPVIGER